MGATVETSYGKLEGFEHGGIHSFRGIPFAQPPVGRLRFRPPQRPARWAGIRPASQFGPAASQNRSPLGPMLGFDIGPTSEDCLYLNVWTPGLDGTRRPVMVWIHGGAFVMGAGSQTLYRGETLARCGDAVIVTINYRLGAFGFLNLQDTYGEALPASGNEGLLDQIAALEWVRDEIAAFGGDPGNVTIFGESAGSISVATLLGTPGARGLFNRAILQSGAANFVSPRAQAGRVADAVLRDLNLTGAAPEQLLNVPATHVLEAQQRVHMALQGQLRGLVFAPVADGEVLPRHPLEAIQGGLSRDVAVLVGTNLDEMKLFGLMDAQARSLDEAGLLRRCERIMPVPDAAGTARRAVETYRRVRRERGAGVAPPELWFAIDSDRAFRYPAMRLAELQRVHQPATYAYLFTWPSPFMEGALGACHALELPFVFGTFDDPVMKTFVGHGPAAQHLAEQMQAAWIAFAHAGNPAHSGLGEWPAYDSDQRATMLLGSECRIEPAPLEGERSFWEFWNGTI